MKELIRALRPVKNRLRLGRAVRGASAGFMLGGAAALALMAVSVFVPIQGRWIYAAAAPVLFALAGALGNALRAVKNTEAARAADACGLRERTVTALETAGKTPEDERSAEILAAQQRDAREHLSALDPKQIRIRIPVRLLACGAALLVLCAAVSLIPGDGVRTARERKQLDEKTAAMADRIEAAAAEEEAGLSEQEKAELRKLTQELKRELRDSRDDVDAMVALDKAESRLEQMRRKDAGDALQALADALRSAGMSAVAEALESGNAQSAASAAADMDADALREAAQGMEGEAKELAEQMAQAMEQGTLSEAQMRSLLSAAQSASAAAQAGGEQKSPMQQALSGMKAALGSSSRNASRNPAPDGTGAGGNGGAGKQNGGGAGTGTTNEEQQGGGAKQSASGGGNRPPEYKEAGYERIYDPEKAETASRDVTTEQNRTGEDSVQVEAGPGKGTLEGTVPYGSILGEYAEAETQAAESARLTQEQKQWVDEYFRRLTE